MRTILIAACCFFTMQLFAQKVFIAPTVAESAEWAKIPYKKTVKKARKGDREALKNMILLYSAIEGKDNALHSRTLLEVMAIVGDSAFSKTLFLDADRKYYPVLKKHLPAGQQLLENQRLKQAALASTFPVCWALLDGNARPYELLHCTGCKNPNSKLSDQPDKGQSDSMTKRKQANKQPSEDEIDPKLIRVKPDSTLQVPPEVEKMIDDIIKKQNEQRSQGGG